MAISFPPAMFLYGSLDPLRKRLLNSTLVTLTKEGYTLVSVSAKEAGAVEEALQGASLTGCPTVIHVTEAEKVPPKGEVLDHIKSPTPGVVLLLESDQDEPKGAVFDAIDKRVRKGYPAPSTWKAHEYAVTFLMKTLADKNLKIEESLADSWVQKVGPDPGVLLFEAEKVGKLLPAGSNVTAAVVRGTMAALSETDGRRVGAAIVPGNRVALLRELDAYHKSRGDEATIALVGSVIYPQVFAWYRALSLEKKGLSPSSAAAAAAANPWYWENKVLPPARSWKLDGCAALIRLCAEAQEAVFRGAADPWNVLVCGLARLTA